jgi:6-phosphogluconolactonase
MCTSKVAKGHGGNGYWQNLSVDQVKRTEIVREITQPDCTTRYQRSCRSASGICCKKGVSEMKTKIFFVTIISIFILTSAVPSAESKGKAGEVYVMTNELDNRVVVFTRDAKGLLTETADYLTGGSGTDGAAIDPLASQSSLILSENKRFLVAVNAGSNEISVFRVLPRGLKLVSKVSSEGDFPTSVTLYHNLLYVLNADSDANITGFTFDRKGKLTPIPGSTRSLGSGAFSQVGFDPQGDVLVVTDRGENEILVFSVDKDGLPSTNPVTSTSEGIAPFGFVFDQSSSVLLVSEAGSGAVSSYRILSDNALEVLDASVENMQLATCWIAENRRGFVYTANTASDTISAYDAGSGDGPLELLDEVAGTGNAPIDLITTGNGRFLYVLNAGDGTVGMFQIRADGSLRDLGTIDGLPSPSAQGIAAD